MLTRASTPRSIVFLRKLKQIKKAGKDKRDKKEMWARLKELNHNFVTMKEQKNLMIKRKSFIFPRFCLF